MDPFPSERLHSSPAGFLQSPDPVRIFLSLFQALFPTGPGPQRCLRCQLHFQLLFPLLLFLGTTLLHFPLGSTNYSQLPFSGRPPEHPSVDPPEHPWTWKFFSSSYNEGIFHMEPVGFFWAQNPDSSHQFQINLIHGINSKFQLIPKDPNSFFP